MKFLNWAPPRAKPDEVEFARLVARVFDSIPSGWWVLVCLDCRELETTDSGWMAAEWFALHRHHVGPWRFGG